MPIADIGPTVFNEDGSVVPSKQLIPFPPNIPAVANSNIPSPAPYTAINNPNIPAPTPAQQGQTNLPKYSIPSDRYADVESQLSKLDPNAMAPHGLHKALDILAGIGTGILTRNPLAGVGTYQALQRLPYNQQANKLRSQLEVIKPELTYQEAQERERGEQARATASQANLERYRESTDADRKQREEAEQRRIADAETKEAALEKQRAEELKRQQNRDEIERELREANERRLQAQNVESEKDRQAQLAIERQRLQIEAKRLNEGSPGTWTVMKDRNGNDVLFNTKTREVAASPGIEKPGDYEKGLGPKQAVNYANDYLKSRTYTGPGDEALLEKFFELAKPSSGFRMTQQQIQLLQKSRSWFEGADAQVLHAQKGYWFSDQQRKEIVDTMNALAKAKGLDTGSNTNKPKHNITIHD